MSLIRRDILSYNVKTYKFNTIFNYKNCETNSFVMNHSNKYKVLHAVKKLLW